jgi:two-component sensor histidine kinase
MGVQSVDILELPGNPGPHHIYNLQTDGSGNFLVITSEGVFRYRSGEPFHLLLQSGKKDAPFLVAQSRPLKLVTRNQLYAYDSGGDKLVFEKKFPLSSGVFCSAESASSIAFGYDRGLQLFFPGKQPVLLLDSVRIQTIHYDQKGDLWVGTWYEGLYRVKIDNLNGRVRYIDTLTSDVGTAFIRSMLIDKKENIWVGTRYNGIVRLSPRPGGNFSKTVFDRKQGLLSDWVYCLSESAEGDIWVGTLSGINKLVPFGNGYRVFNFSRVLNFYATVNSIVTFPGKNVICSSDKGVLRFTETGLEKQEALPVIITNVHLGQSDSNYAISGRNIRLKYFQNYAGFEFTSTGYVNEKEMLYSYRLMGSADTGWSLPASVHAVEYASLKPGNYRFEVRMFGWNGYYGPVNGFPFHIGKPWWQTGVFYGLLALLVTGLLYMFYQYRIRQLVRIHQVRNHIATDLHDDIGSTLTNISILSELSMKTLQQPAVASQFLSRIKDEVQSSNQALDDIIWSVNSRNDSMQETIARMRRFAGDLFDNTSTLCHLEIAEPAPGRRLNMEQRRDLYLIYKESLTNIYKHAAAKNVWIRIKLSPQWLDLEIEDDGKGFETDILTHRNGLKNLRFRVEKWQGSLQLDSVAGKGTRIVIKWPVGNSVPS